MTHGRSNDMLRFEMRRVNSTRAIREAVGELLSGPFADKLPRDRGARILIKPNLNSNMNALTGNTSDLRVLAGLLATLKDKGYKRITIGEGTNSGFFRYKISVIARLRLDRLAQYYGVEVQDFNYSQPHPIPFEDGVTAHVARECVESDLFINVPKLKTHFEVGMSVCLKNLIGTLIGQINKKKTHLSLSANIINLNLHARPHLQLVDGVIGMEGLGPSRGTPLNTGVVFMGDDPFLIDMLCAKFAGFDYRKVKTLALAESKGLLTEEHKRFAAAYPIDGSHVFEPARPGPLAAFIHHPKRQKHFLAIRNTKFFEAVCSTKWAGAMLFLTGLRQDVFLEEDLDFQGLTLNREKCTDCGVCDNYCPVDLALPRAIAEGDMARCIGCLYCHAICPESAIDFQGTLGFMAEQYRQYDHHIRGLHKTG